MKKNLRKADKLFLENSLQPNKVRRAKFILKHSSPKTVGFFGIPFAVLASVGLPRNIYLCLFNMSLLIVLCTISIYCLVAVSVDRYWAILYPMSYSRNVRSKTAIGEWKN
ncbi:hypothetical protein RUM44_007832 [Polyplax serrata]|uniref:G-protein coupled receptors family 1 profile domain-containing protein n=1 Tax=Polyplax serrata TaxID=468196 RepID=A0ABR1B7A8_POLSC